MTRPLHCFDCHRPLAVDIMFFDDGVSLHRYVCLSCDVENKFETLPIVSDSAPIGVSSTDLPGVSQRPVSLGN